MLDYLEGHDTTIKLLIRREVRQGQKEIPQ